MENYVYVVLGFVWSRDHNSYADCRLATGKASDAGQVKADYRHYKGYTGPPAWGKGTGMMTPHFKKTILS